MHSLNVGREVKFVPFASNSFRICAAGRTMLLSVMGVLGRRGNLLTASSAHIVCVTLRVLRGFAIIYGTMLRAGVPSLLEDTRLILSLVLEARSMMTERERNFQLSRQRGHCFLVLLPTVLMSNTDLIQMSFFG